MFTIISAVFNLQPGDAFIVLHNCGELYRSVEFSNVYKLPGVLDAPVSRKRLADQLPLRLYLSNDFIAKYAKLQEN